MKKLLLSFAFIFFAFSSFSQLSVISQTNATCNGTCNAAVTFSINGGTPPYALIFSASGCNSVPPAIAPGPTVTVSGICPCASGYMVMAYDSFSTTIGMVNVFISQPAQLNAFTLSKTNVCCNGLCNGSISMQPTGGTAPYTYTWTPGGMNTSSVSNLCAGNYTLALKDANGCINNIANFITQPAPFTVSASIVAASCPTCCNGQVSASGAGGNPGYTYTMYPGGITGPGYSSVCPGTYSLCGSDAGCCSTCIGFSVGSGSATSVTNLSAEAKFEVYPNPTSGSIKIISSSDLSQYNYQLFDLLGKRVTSGKAEENLNIESFQNGIYFLKVTDNNDRIITTKKLVLRQD